MAVTGSKEIDIEAKPAAIMEVIADVEALPSWSPVHKKAEVIERDDDGRPLKARMSVSILGVNDEQVLEYTWTGDEKVEWTLVESSQQKSQKASYVLTPSGDKTHVTFELTLDPKVPLPGFLIKKGTKTVLEAATKGLREQVIG